MGNRAVITEDKTLNGVGIYLHWNGGRDSVEAFLAYCKMKNYRTGDYGMAMLANVITNTFADGMSCGVDTCVKLDCDNYDNGVFVIEKWLIVGRIYRRSGEQLNYDLREMLEEIDKAQPEPMRLKQEEWAKFDEVKKMILEHRAASDIAKK